MKYLIALVLSIYNIAYSQNIDYNLQDDFIAKSYDVVAYFDNEPKEGSSQFITSFNSVNFKFSSKENLNKFLKNPSKYIPQYGGYCAYAIATNSKKVDINPKTFEIRNGKLYLFYNSWGNNTLKKWLRKDTNALLKKADLNWSAVRFKN